MRYLTLALLLITMKGYAASSITQPNSYSYPSLFSPRYDISVGYQYTRANSPPGGCKCFGMMGGYETLTYHVNDWLGIAANITAGHSNNISALGQNLTLMTYTAGPRFTYPGNRIRPFGQFLFGVAKASDSYFPSGNSSSTSASSLAVIAGGGVDISLSDRLSIQAVDAQFVRTQLPNGTNNSQNHLSVGIGLVVKFGRMGLPRMAMARPDLRDQLSLSCMTNVTNLDQGDTLEITADPKAEPEDFVVDYRWSTNGGKILGAGRRITVNTSGLPEGDYRVTGHAFSAVHPSIAADCNQAFHVRSQAAKMQVPISVPEPHEDLEATIIAQDKKFHENVQDALFDYDSYEIRPDAQAATNHAAEYLQENPEIQVLVGGYADERGSSEYNLALGQERANSAREALISAGVDPERVQIISYGKELQVCKEGNEDCWQQNRRAAFSMHH